MEGNETTGEGNGTNNDVLIEKEIFLPPYHLSVGAIFKDGKFVEGKTYSLDLEPRQVFNAKNKHVHNTSLYQNSSIDIDYFIKQKEFIDNLSEDDKLLLASYTHYGDRIINNFLRKIWTGKTLLEFLNDNVKEVEDRDKFKNLLGVSIDLITEQNFMKIIGDFVEKFRKVFMKVPILEKPLRVFRGIEVDSTFDPRKGGIPSPTIDYLSTTYDPYEGPLHLYSGESCCIYEIVINKGVRALWVEPMSKYQHEREIIIENNVIIYNGCRKYKTLTYGVYKNDDFAEETRQIDVFEFEIKPYTLPITLTSRLRNGLTRIYSKFCGTRGTKKRGINNNSKKRNSKGNNSNSNDNNSKGRKRRKIGNS